MALRPRGKSLTFFRTSSLKSQKSHMQKSQNHELNHMQKAKKPQITEKLLKNHTKKSLKSQKKSKKKSQKKSCDSKITYAILRSDLPLVLGNENTFWIHIRTTGATALGHGGATFPIQYISVMLWYQHAPKLSTF